MTDPRALQVFCTIDSELRARDIAASLVDGRLAACVQVVGPIHSTYRWEETIETAVEWLLLIKTADSRFEELRAAIVSVHPYDVPEIVAVPIEAGLPEYISWIVAST